MGLYGDLERALTRTDDATRAVLTGVALLALFVAWFQPSSTLRAAAAAWFVLP